MCIWLIHLCKLHIRRETYLVKQHLCKATPPKQKATPIRCQLGVTFWQCFASIISPSKCVESRVAKDSEGTIRLERSRETDKYERQSMCFGFDKNRKKKQNRRKQPEAKKESVRDSKSEGSRPKIQLQANIKQQVQGGTDWARCSICSNGPLRRRCSY